MKLVWSTLNTDAPFYTVLIKNLTSANFSPLLPVTGYGFMPRAIEISANWDAVANGDGTSTMALRVYHTPKFITAAHVAGAQLVTRDGVGYNNAPSEKYTFITGASASAGLLRTTWSRRANSYANGILEEAIGGWIYIRFQNDGTLYNDDTAYIRADINLYA